MSHTTATMHTTATHTRATHASAMSHASATHTTTTWYMPISIDSSGNKVADMPLCSRTRVLDLLTPHTCIQPTHVTLDQDAQDEFAVFRYCTDSHAINCLKIGQYEDVGCLAQNAILAETCFCDENIQDMSIPQQGILMHEYLLDEDNNVLVRRSTPLVILQRGKSRGLSFLRVQCKHTTNTTFWCREVDVVVIPPGWTCHVLPYSTCDCIVNPTRTRHVECHVFLPKKEMVRVYASTRKKARPNGNIQDLAYNHRDHGIEFHWQEDACSDSAITGCIVLLRLDANP